MSGEQIVQSWLSDPALSWDSPIQAAALFVRQEKISQPPGFAVEQPAQEAGDFAFTGAGVENPPVYSHWKRDEPGSCNFRHVGWVWAVPALFDAC